MALARLRPRLLWALPVPAVLLVIGVVAAVARSGSDGKPTKVAAAGSTSVPATGVATTATPLTIPPATSTTTTAAPARTTTTSLRTTTTTTATSTTSSTVLADCDRAKLVLSPAKTNKATYRPGETITVTATVTNTSAQACGYGIGGMSTTLRDAAGREDYGGAIIIDYFARPISQPGEVHPASQDLALPESGAPNPGAYSVIFKVDGMVAAPAPIQILAR